MTVKVDIFMLFDMIYPMLSVLLKLFKLIFLLLHLRHGELKYIVSNTITDSSTAESFL